MGNPWFGSKASSGLWQALVALMPPHAVYIETHLGGGRCEAQAGGAAQHRDRPGARALSSFECGHAVELVNADCPFRPGPGPLQSLAEAQGGARACPWRLDEPGGRGHREGVVQLRTGPGALGVVRGARLHAPPDRQAQGGELGPALPGDASGGAPGGAGRGHGEAQAPP